MGSLSNGLGRRFNPRTLRNLKLWYDAGTVVQASGVVSQWTDLSGNGNHATQATSGRRPVNNLTTQGGFPVVHADGSDDQMAFPALTLVDWSIVVVGKVTTAGENVVFVGNSAVNVQAARLDDSVPSMQVFDGGAAYDSSTSNLSQYAVYEWCRKGGPSGTYDFYKNGVQQTSVHLFGTGATDVTLNCLWMGIDGFRKSDNLAVLITDGEISTGDRAWLVAGLRSRFQV